MHRLLTVPKPYWHAHRAQVTFSLRPDPVGAQTSRIVSLFGNFPISILMTCRGTVGVELKVTLSRHCLACVR